MARSLNKRENGEGTIFYRESLKKWVGQVSLGQDNDGKQIRKTFYGNTRKEVKDKMEFLQRELQTGKDVNNKLSIVDIANEIRELKYNTNSIKRASYIRIGETIDIMQKILPFANIPIQNVTRSIINMQSQSLTSYSQSVITKVWQQLQGAFNEARIRDIVDKNPFELKGYLMKPKSSKPTKEIDALTLEEEERFIKELDNGYDDYTIVFYIAIYTGMRISEILALKREDIDLENKKIYVRKTLSHVVLQRILGHKDIQVTLNTYTSVFHEFKEKEIEKINSIF